MVSWRSTTSFPWATGESVRLCPWALPVDLGLLVYSGEKTAKDLNITREEQDAYAIASYKKAAAAWAAKAFEAEIAPVTIADKRKGDVVIVEDEEFKKVKLDKIPSLRPVFQKDGTITAANASTLNDGASALVLASQEKVDELSLKPLARIVCEWLNRRYSPNSQLTSCLPSQPSPMPPALPSISPSPPLMPSH